MNGDRLHPDGDGSLADTVLVSNRGPFAFHLEDGLPVPGAAGGGLSGSLHPMVAGSGATWVASALSEADRVAASTSNWSTPTPTSTTWPTTSCPTPRCGSATTISSTPPAGPASTGAGWRHGRPTAN